MGKRQGGHVAAEVQMRMMQQQVKEGLDPLEAGRGKRGSSLLGTWLVGTLVVDF